MRLSTLTCLASELDFVINKGLHQDVTRAEVDEHIERGDILVWLKSRLKSDVDLSLVMPQTDLGAPEDIEGKHAMEFIKFQVVGSKMSAKEGEELLDALDRTANVIGGDWEHGLCYLIYLLLCMIGSKEWES